MTQPIRQLSQATLKDLPKVLPLLSQKERERLLLELDHLEFLKNKALCEDKFLFFAQHMWPGFISGRHHARMADAFERVARGESKRLIINMPPRHTKSEFASYLLPAWFLGKNPGKKIIQASHTAELAVGFGRKVRNLVDTAEYHKIFPELELSADSKAAGRWNTSKKGEYYAIGIGGAIAGKGADLFIIDDPHSEQEAQAAEANPEIYDKVYEWYTSGPRQRLQPGGSVVIVMCMTGDTPVLRPDGTETPLKDIRPGDEVATYEDGALSTSRVLNWRSSGVDAVYTIQTQSGKVVRANARHPFLVDKGGEREWVRLQDLKPGMSLVALADVSALQDHSLSPGCADLANPAKATTARTPEPHAIHRGIMESGKARLVQSLRALNRHIATACADHTATRLLGLPVNMFSLQSSGGHIASNPAMASLPISMTGWLPTEGTDATSVETPLPAQTPARTGAESSVSTTATTPEKSGDCSVTTAISPLGMEKPPIPCSALQSIYAFTADKIVSITPSGHEEVFDVEIERTENFIANGLVSHNTRWGKRDLTGQVLKAALQRGGEKDEWELIEFPAILPSGNPLWPEFWSLDELTALKEELPNTKWMAQYQQNPTSEEGAIIKRDWWREWDSDVPPKCEFVLMAWDTAFEKSQRSDYSACTTWGIFYAPDATGKEQANLILLNAFRKRMEFPELKKEVLAQYKDWKPDGIIIEKKASGAPLIYELRSMGIPVQEFTPTKGNDKISRVNAISDIFASGRVWYPNTSWAEEVVNEVAEFPASEHDDFTDTVSMAVMRFRQGGYLRAELDEPDPVRYFKRKTKGYY